MAILSFKLDQLIMLLIPFLIYKVRHGSQLPRFVAFRFVVCSYVMRRKGNTGRSVDLMKVKIHTLVQVKWLVVAYRYRHAGTISLPTVPYETFTPTHEVIKCHSVISIYHNDWQKSVLRSQISSLKF
jgi:hypothetical protein